MGIKNLKKDNEILSMSLIDMLSKYDISKTKKYTQFLVKMMKREIQTIFEYDTESQYELKTDDEFFDLFNPKSIDGKFLNHIIQNCFIGSDRLRLFTEFTKLMERGVIENKDISTYDSWDMMEGEFFRGKHKQMFKDSKKEVKKIYEDEDYLILKPLTYNASCVYGYNTKWCTAMITDPSYFYSHSMGVLIYLMDKKRNKKFAFHNQVPSLYDKFLFDDTDQRIFKTWDETDKNIDSIQSGLPFSILELIYNQFTEDIKNRNRNCNLFSKEELDKFKMHCELPDSPLEQPIEEPAIQITRRVTEFPTLTATRPALRRIPRLYTTANTTGSVQIEDAFPLPMEEPMFKFDLEDDIEVEDVLP
jgi:hypothetical protein